MAEHTMLRRISNSIINLGFAAAIGLPLLLFSSLPWTDPIEKRTSAPPPPFPVSLSAARKFPAEYEAFFNDHFGMRRQLIRIRNEIDTHLFKRSPTARVLIGRNDWLFYTGEKSIEDFAGQTALSPAELDTWDDQLKQRRDWFRAQGILYDFVIAPNKQSIYPEFMPGFIKEQKHNRLAALEDRLAGTDEASIFVDLRPALLAHKADLPLYHPIDAHWNSYGAYFGYRAIMEKLAADGAPSLHILDLGPQSFVRSDMKSGDLANMMGFSRYPTTVHTTDYIGPAMPCTWHEAAIEPALIGVDIGRLGPDIASDCTLPGRPLRVLVFDDSMIESMRAYLVNSFSHIRFVWGMPSLDNIKRYVELEHPDIVIEERVERMLSNVPQPAKPPVVTISSTTPPADRKGWVEITEAGSQSIVVDGWALWRSNAAGRSIVIDTNLALTGTTLSEMDRLDVVAALKDDRLARSGFHLLLDIDPAKARPDPIRLCIWTDDPVMGRHRLNYTTHPEWDFCPAEAR